MLKRNGIPVGVEKPIGVRGRKAKTAKKAEKKQDHSVAVDGVDVGLKSIHMDSLLGTINHY